MRNRQLFGIIHDCQFELMNRAICREQFKNGIHLESHSSWIAMVLSQQEQNLLSRLEGNYRRIN
jgi:hypothetical protein